MSDKNDLTGRLDQYAIAAKGQITGGRGLGEIAGYAAAVGAGLAMAGAADASIIYSGLRNINVAINPNATSATSTTSIDIDSDASPDLVMAIGVDAGGTTGTKYGVGIAALGATGGAQLLLASTAYGFSLMFGANVPGSHTVGPGGAFGTAKYLAGIVANEFNATTANVNLGNFALGVTGVAGFHLGSGNYGWIRLRIDDLGPNQPLGGTKGIGLPDRITAIDWAYDDSGAAIHVPAPTPLALLAAGALGIGVFRRRKALQAEQA